MEQPTVSNEIAEHLAAQMDQRKQAEAQAAAVAAAANQPDARVAAAAAELAAAPEAPKTAVFDQRSAVVKRDKQQERNVYIKQNKIGLIALVIALAMLTGAVALLAFALSK